MKERIYRAGERIGTFEVLEHLGSGGVSAIYKVKHLVEEEKDEVFADEAEEMIARVFEGPLKQAPENIYALKISKFEMSELPAAFRVELCARLHREYLALLGARRGGVVRVHDCGYHEGNDFFTMELLKGPTLDHFLREQRRRYREVMGLFLKVAETVAHLHWEGTIHRDLKPANIIVEPGRGPVVLDLGICQPLLRDMATVLTAPGAILGTLERVVPEYAAYLLSSERETTLYRAETALDVYLLGVLLYELLTGQLPTQTPPGRLFAYLTEVRDTVPPHPCSVVP